MNMSFELEVSIGKMLEVSVLTFDKQHKPMTIVVRETSFKWPITGNCIK